MFSSTIIPLLIFGAFIVFLIYLAVRARKGRISVTTPLGANHDLFNQDQRKAAKVIVQKAAGEQEEDQDSGDPPRPGPRGRAGP
jgi:hypothetical protein